MEGKIIASVLISIVSHGQGSLIKNLLLDLESALKGSLHSINVVVTINFPENERFLTGYPGLQIHVIRNSQKKGYGENHNYAFDSIRSDFFMILNPDVRFNDNLVDPLIQYLESSVGVVAPRVVDLSGSIEDSFRKFPTIFNIIKRTLRRSFDGDYGNPESGPQDVDWVAGMFMFFASPTFKSVEGFDERYFMYLEDADICRRLRRKGLSVVYVPGYEIIHEARRTSRKNLKYLTWHVRSMIRFLFDF